jgi:hypothetical protein
MQLQHGRRRYTQARVPAAHASGARALPRVPQRVYLRLVILVWLGNILAHWSVSDRWRRMIDEFSVL